MTEVANASGAKCFCGKRKRVVLSLESNPAILDHLKARATQESLADAYGIGRLTVGDIKKNEEKIRSFTLTKESMVISKNGRKV